MSVHHILGSSQATKKNPSGLPWRFSQPDLLAHVVEVQILSHFAIYSKQELFGLWLPGASSCSIACLGKKSVQPKN